MQRKIMFIIDNPYRELWGITSIAAKLRNQGIGTIIASKMNYVLQWECYRPEAVVFPRVTYDMAEFARRISKYSWIFLLPSEHGGGFRDKVIMNAAVRHPDGRKTGDEATNVVDHVFVGGRNQFKWLNESKIFDQDRMTVAGTLNSDHWCLRAFEGKKVAQRKEQRVGVATTNKSLFFGVPVNSVIDLLNEHRPGSWQDTIWRVDFAAYEMAHMLILSEAIEGLQKKSCKISMRPHPHEYVPQWNDYVKNLGSGAELNRDLRIDSWLDSVSMVLASFSTVSVDAIAHGLPSFSLHNIVPKRYFEALPSMKQPLMAPYAWAPESLEEFFHLVDRSISGNLEPSPEMDAAKSFMQDNFNFPRTRFACEIIADGIAKVAERSKNPQLKTSAMINKTTLLQGPLKWLRRIPVLRSILVFATYIKTYLTNDRRGNLYFPFSLKQKNGSRFYAKRILQANSAQ